MASQIVPSAIDRAQGLATLEAVLNDLGQPAPNLTSATLRARHAFTQVGMRGFADQCSQELAGYQRAER